MAGAIDGVQVADCFAGAENIENDFVIEAPLRTDFHGSAQQKENARRWKIRADNPFVALDFSDLRALGQPL